jgi:hypothetical protein
MTDNPTFMFIKLGSHKNLLSYYGQLTVFELMGMRNFRKLTVKF